MSTELVVAIIAGIVAFVSAAGTIWSSIRNAERSDANARAIAQLKFESDRLKLAAQREQEIANFKEPLARAAYDLQSRIFNILKLNVVDVYFTNGSDREKKYIVDNTAFLVAQYMCWTEMVRREIQFIDLGSSEKTHELLSLQDRIFSAWATDEPKSKIFRIFAGEQRAIGEALISIGPRGPECIGYGAFLTTFTEGSNPLIDDLRADVISLGRNLDQGKERLTNLQHAFIDLLKMLDPNYLRFPEKSRTKV